LLGIAGLTPALLGVGASRVHFAVGLGGVILAQRAFGKIAPSFACLADASIGWRLLKPLFEAASASVIEPQVAPPPPPRGVSSPATELPTLTSPA